MIFFKMMIGLILCGSLFYAFSFLLCQVLNGLSSKQKTKELFNQRLNTLKQKQLKKIRPINVAIRLVIQPCIFSQLSKKDKQFIVDAVFNEHKLHDLPKLQQEIAQ